MKNLYIVIQEITVYLFLLNYFCHALFCLLVFVLFTVPVSHIRPRRRRHRSPSLDRSVCRIYCINCGIVSDIQLCPRCSMLQQCLSCKRHLKPIHFIDNTNRCRACTRKVRGTRRACGSTVLEYDIDVDPMIDVDYSEFINNNGDVMNNIINQAQQQYR